MPKALVIDDSRAMRIILANALRELGFDVSQASNGREGLEAMDREGTSFEVVLVDWNMPEVTGLEFVERVRARLEFSSVPLMMVTTETEIEQVMKALDAGANEYMMKPFTREAVEDKLRLMGILV